MERQIIYDMLYSHKKENVYSADFWYDLGRCYIAPLVGMFEQDEHLEEKIKGRYPSDVNGNFGIQQLLLLYFGLWDEVSYNSYADERKRIEAELKRGVTEILERDSASKEGKTIIEAETYLREGLSVKEKIALQQLPVLHNAHDGLSVFPLTMDGEYKIGIVNPWPGDKSAEAEVLSRMAVAAEDAGITLIMLDNFGHILNRDTQQATETIVNPSDLQFVITTHYDTEKTVDAFYYHTLWNPPEIPLNLPEYYSRVTNNYLMNDDYLIYDFGGMANHLRGILLNCPRTLEGASSLTASFPKSKILSPKLDNPMLFYCGMNWEKIVDNSNRHEGLFRLLDETGKVKFFGPEKVEAWGGIRPWEGYKCYQYSIPFDGFSILDEINQCGICLVLSSDIHRRAGAATNRTYEACAAGAVIISDDNEFMQHYFKDAALFIEYNKNNPEDTYQQIMEKYDWIINHKEEALRLAKRAQEIFITNFSLDNQLIQMIQNHYKRFRTIEKDLFTEDESGCVLVTYVVNTLDVNVAEETCKKVLQNVMNQYYRNIKVAIACDKRVGGQIRDLVSGYELDIKVFTMDLFDHKGARYYTDGQAIRILQRECKHEYWINTVAHEIWFYDHITTMLRTLQESNAVCAYSGRCHEDKYGLRRLDNFDKIHAVTVFGMIWPDWLPVPGQVIYKRECHEYVPDYMMECLDGYEHYAYLGMIWLKGKQIIEFSRRMTCCWRGVQLDERSSVLKEEFQIRYLRDIFRFDVPDGGWTGGNDVKGGTMQSYMLGIPIKAWLKVRWYKMLLRFAGQSDSKRKQRLKNKYDKAVIQFEEWR